MATPRQRKYFEATKTQKKSTSPIDKKEDVYTSPDNKIDMDHPGFPHGQSEENIISPENDTDRKTAAVNVTDGEKKNTKNDNIDEGKSDGSGGAFEASEEVKE